jgi:hypothetical protein
MVLGENGKMSQREEEIRRIVKKLEAKWLQLPMLRLGQLIDNAVGERDPFYVTDSMMEYHLDNYPYTEK